MRFFQCKFLSLSSTLTQRLNELLFSRFLPYLHFIVRRDVGQTCPNSGECPFVTRLKRTDFALCVAYIRICTHVRMLRITSGFRCNANVKHSNTYPRLKLVRANTWVCESESSPKLHRGRALAGISLSNRKCISYHVSHFTYYVYRK